MRFHNKVVLVTGAGSGIGEATARHFSEEGAAVVLVGDHRANIAKVAKDVASAVATPVAASDADFVERLDGPFEADEVDDARSS